MPIGNLTSQFFANVYLNQLDQFIKHKLKAKYYLRYVDDFIILGVSIEELKLYRKKIDEFLADNLLIRLHPIKQKIMPVKNGIDFVGYVIRAEYVLMRRRVVWQWRRAQRDCFATIAMTNVNNSYLAYAKWANSWSLQSRLNVVSL